VRGLRATSVTDVLEPRRDGLRRSAPSPGGVFSLTSYMVCVPVLCWRGLDGCAAGGGDDAAAAADRKAARKAARKVAKKASREEQKRAAALGATSTAPAAPPCRSVVKRRKDNEPTPPAPAAAAVGRGGGVSKVQHGVVPFDEAALAKKRRKKAVKKLTKTLGRAPAEAEISAYVAKRLTKAAAQSSGGDDPQQEQRQPGMGDTVEVEAEPKKTEEKWVGSEGEPPRKGQVPDGKGGWHWPPRPPPTGNNSILLFYGYVSPAWDRRGQDAMIAFARETLARHGCTGRLRVARVSQAFPSLAVHLD
jgi:hypothetical protein